MAKKTLILSLPDWLHLDTVLNAKTPFALWTIGDQPLLYHWLDYAVNQDYEHVIFYVIDRPALIREALSRATLWPIEWEVRAVHSYEEIEVACMAHHFPESLHTEINLRDGWDLLNYWMQLQREWLNKTFANTNELEAQMLGIGRFCTIHPSATLQQPVFMGDYVHIGPDCTIGPYAVIGSGSVLAGPSHVEQAIIAPHTFLAGHTELTNCYLEGGKLFQLKHKVHLSSIDSFIAGSLQQLPQDQKPRLLERLEAFYLWAKASFKSLFLAQSSPESLINHQGLTFKTYASDDLLCERREWLWMVVRGEIRLVGILPRTKEDLAQLSPDWQKILNEAPVGVFSYADCHDPAEEGLHAVYQATQPRSLMEELIKRNWKTCIKKFVTQKSDS